MDKKVIAGASIGAILGAGLWIVVAIMMQAEWGVAAWFVGGLVGYGAYMAGETDQRTGMLCAVLAVVAIVGGKAGALAIALPYEIKSMLQEGYPGFDQAAYDETKQDATDFFIVDRNDYDSVTEFMVSHSFTDASAGSEVTQAEVDYFFTEQVSGLERFERERPGFETWRDGRLDAAYAAFVGSVPKSKILSSMFSLFDFLWFFLGVGTAFRVGSGQVSTE